MRTISLRHGHYGLSMLVGFCIFLFYWTAYPQLLSFHEQYQLFLWTSDYFMKRILLPGGLADWLGELLVQFYYIEWFGALLTAILYVAVQQTVWQILPKKWSTYPLCLIPVALLFWMMSDESTLLSYPIALIITIITYIYNGTRGTRGLLCDLIITPILYWSIGPVSWTYVLLRIVNNKQKWSWLLIAYLFTLQLLCYFCILSQWPLITILLGINYYRIPMTWPVLIWLTPLIIIFFNLTAKKSNTISGVIGSIVFLSIVVIAISKGYHTDRQELIRQDYLIRNERWDDIIERAKSKEVRVTFWSNSINLALSQKRQLADNMFDYWQSGPDALIMNSQRDMFWNLPTAEAFWRLGMINSTLRYVSDLQESILNGRKSGRFEKRIAECYLVNGKFELARKHLHLLKQSLFYSRWAEETEQLLGNETAINQHPIYGRLRNLRFKEDFLYSYQEIDKVLGRLFIGNKENRMALDYFIAQNLLNGDAPTFQQALPWAEQYGGYHKIPRGYQDVLNCILQQGNVPGSPYAAFVGRMIRETQKQNNNNNDETAH